MRNEATCGLGHSHGDSLARGISGMGSLWHLVGVGVPRAVRRRRADQTGPSRHRPAGGGRFSVFGRERGPGCGGECVLAVRGREWPDCPGCAKNAVLFGLAFVSLSCLDAASYVLLWPAGIVRIVRMDPDNLAGREKAASPPEARPIRSLLARQAERRGSGFRAGIGPEVRGGVPFGPCREPDGTPRLRLHGSWSSLRTSVWASTHFSTLRCISPGSALWRSLPLRRTSRSMRCSIFARRT